MLGTFKIRMLVVIIIAGLIALVMQSGHSSKQVVEPVLAYIMGTDYELGKVISTYIHIPNGEKLKDSMPATGVKVLDTPCTFQNIDRKYGWYWNPSNRKQEFYPGIHLEVESNTEVKSMLEGQVEEIRDEEGEKVVTIRHNDEFVSVYGELKEVLVEKDSTVENKEIIGITGESLYFELRSKDGPVNPLSIFE